MPLRNIPMLKDVQLLLKVAIPTLRVVMEQQLVVLQHTLKDLAQRHLETEHIQKDQRQKQRIGRLTLKVLNLKQQETALMQKDIFHMQMERDHTLKVVKQKEIFKEELQMEVDPMLKDIVPMLKVIGLTQKVQRHMQ